MWSLIERQLALRHIKERDGAAVALYAIQSRREIWRGTRFSGDDVPATNRMWSLFTRHPKA